MLGLLNRRSGETDKRLPAVSRWSWMTGALLVVIGAILGFVIGRFGPKAFALKYNATWDIANVLTAVFTIAIALYVQHAVARGSEAIRERRRYLSELARRVSTEWETLHSVLRESRPDINTVAAALRTVDVAILDLRDAMIMCRVSISCERLETAWLRYRGTLHDFPEPLTTAEQALLQKHFVDGRKAANWLVLALPTS